MTTVPPLQAEVEGSISYMRQRDWFDPAANQHAHVTMVGCGGIGSFAAFALAKLGIPRFTLIDPDEVERHNIPNQMFPIYEVGNKSKVDALTQSIEDYAGEFIQVNAIQDSLQSVGTWNGVVVSALDSMEARADLWAKVKGQLRVPLFIDARLGGQNIRLFCIKPLDREDQEYYEASLHTDEEAVEDSCTARSIIDVGFVVASLITRAVRLHYTSQPIEREVYLNQATLQIMKG